MDMTSTILNSIWTRSHQPEQWPCIGAHRGASTQAGENSQAAFERAIAAGADFIELDWRLTRDGTPVVFHDETLTRLHSDDRHLCDIDFAELRLIAPSIMTVVEVLTLTRNRICLLLDTKIVDPVSLKQGLESLAADLHDDTVGFGTRTLAASQVVRDFLPDSPVIGLFGSSSDYDALWAMGGGWARLWESEASPENIAALQKIGLRVIVMVGAPTPDGVGHITQDTLNALLRRKPDAVMLNDISLGLATRDSCRLQNEKSRYPN
jgi:glycerophosphoryl diester phosphodiesterase